MIHKNSKHFRSSGCFLSAILCIGIAGNCAAFNRKNTPLIGLIEKHLVPEEMPAKALAAPLYIPPGLVAGMLDVFVIHPIMEVPDAWKDMVDLFWTGDAGYVTAMGSMPIRLAASPVMLVLDVLTRSAFDFHRNNGEETINDPEARVPLADLVQQGDLKKIESRLGSTEITRADNSSLLKIFEMSKSSESLHRMTLVQLGSFMDLNEAWLITQLGKNAKDDTAIAEAFQNAQSRRGGRALLDQLGSRDLPRETAVLFIQVIFSIDDPALTKALIKRIRSGKE